MLSSTLVTYVYFNRKDYSLSLSMEYQPQKKYTSVMSFCRVCSAEARYFHYGVIVCFPCKTFFRRHTSYTKCPRRCDFHGKCSITPRTRKNCNACRYAKCLAVGMSSDFIRKEDFSGMHTPKSKAIMSVSALPTLNLLNRDCSSLSQFNWTLFSNVVHAFDNFVYIPQTRQTMEWLAIPPIDLSQLFSLFATFYTSAEAFIGSSTDFRILTIDEKCSLYQRNLHGVLHLFATFIWRLSGMFDCIANENLLIASYGYDVLRQVKRIALQLEDDIAINKLLLFILAFSSNCYPVHRHESTHNDPFLHGTYRLFGSQNVYVEILWRYMIYRYGYYEAARRFARLIKLMLDLLKISEAAQQTNEIHQNFVEEISVVTGKSLVIRNNDTAPLWGKT